MLSEHTATCQVCGIPAQRIYSSAEPVNRNKPVYALFNRDGSYQECPDLNSPIFSRSNVRNHRRRR